PSPACPAVVTLAVPNRLSCRFAPPPEQGPSRTTRRRPNPGAGTKSSRLIKALRHLLSKVNQ
ncbi:MAG TPA: hypothetical protein PKZ99_08905, partial [Azospirillaceae bacterium]|nr:hypothetical protein [Azospirillaceae bacterium]